VTLRCGSNYRKLYQLFLLQWFQNCFYNIT